MYIVGAGSVGGHLAYNIETYIKDAEIVGFFDDDPGKVGSDMFGYPVLGPVDELVQLADVNVVFGIAFPKIKKGIVEKLSVNKTLLYPTLIHEKAWVSKGVTVGEGSIIYPGTTINYGCSVASFVVMNMNCALGHHTTVGNYTSFAPGVCTGGHTEIGDCVEMGVGASTIQNVRIGDRSIVGGQSMVVKDVEKGSRMAGVPARSMKE